VDFVERRQAIQAKISQFIEADVNEECSNFWTQRVKITAKLRQSHQVRMYLFFRNAASNKRI